MVPPLAVLPRLPLLLLLRLRGARAADPHATTPCSAAVGSGALHRCATAPPAQRADDLLSVMTPAEIVQQTWAVDGGRPEQLLAWTSGAGGAGSVSLGDARSPEGNLTDTVARRNDLQRRIMASSAHGIPASFFNEALHSANAGGTVCEPRPPTPLPWP